MILFGTKRKTMIEKDNESVTTNDGYIVSDMFCQPLQRKREFNMMEGV